MSVEGYQKMEGQGGLQELYGYIDPIVLLFLVTEEVVDRGDEGARESLMGKLYKSIRYKGTNSMQKEELEPFFKKEIKREIYDIFKDKRSMLKMCKLETVKTIEAIFNMLSEKYKLQEGDIKKIKVSWWNSL